MKIMKIAIIGTGNMGSWLAKALMGRKGGDGAGLQIAIYNRHPEKARKIAALLPGVKCMESVSELSDFAPDMLLNTVSLQNTVEAFAECAPYLKKGCLLADAASIKNGIPEFYSKCGMRFVSVHPMFGPTFADMDLPKGENAVVISESDAEGADFFRGLFKSLGLNLFSYSFAEHDAVMGYSLTTPFASSLVFAACVDSKAVPGTTFAKHMALARGVLSEDDKLLSEILFNAHSLKTLEKITARLEHLKHIIKGKDAEEASKFFGKLRKNIN